MVMRLHDIALFTVAQDLWQKHVDFSCGIWSVHWEKTSANVASLVSPCYPGIPVLIEERIINCVQTIGDEIAQLLDYRSLNCVFLNCLLHLRVRDIVWTSEFTIDRLKTLFMASTVKIQVREYSEPVPMWIECLWAKQEQENKLIASEYFANDRFFVFLLWVCYMKTAVVRNPTEGKWIECFRDIKRTIEFATNFRMPFFGDHLAHFRRYYEGNTPVENVFRFLVISGNVVYFPRYLSKMNPEMQRTNLFVMAEFFLTEYNPDQFRTNERTVVSTALYLWHSMEFCDRFRIVQTHFKEFFRFILSFEGTEILIPAVKWYNPPVQSCRDNRRFLIQAAAGIPLIHKKSQKHRQIFHILYKKIGSMLNVIDVVHLLETILVIKDIDTAVLMVRVLDKEKKNQLLNAIHSIWNDLWKESIENETFLTFFFEVQSGIIGPTVGDCD